MHPFPSLEPVVFSSMTLYSTIMTMIWFEPNYPVHHQFHSTYTEYRQVKGQVNTGARPVDTFTFLDHSLTLWSKAMGDPSNPSTPSSSVSRYSGKLFGVYHWPFSFTLPQEVILPDVNGAGNARQAFRLPQTFLERLTQPSIHYELIVHIIRSKFRVDTK